MAVVVGTNSYGDETGLQAYADARGITLTGDLTINLIKAMDYLEIQSYKGDKYSYSQALQHPRTFYEIVEGDEAGVVADDIITGQYLAATLIDAGNDLNPIVGRETKKEKVDVIEVEYMDSAASTALYPQLTKTISRFLSSSGTSFEVIRA